MEKIVLSGWAVKFLNQKVSAALKLLKVNWETLTFSDCPEGFLSLTIYPLTWKEKKWMGVKNPNEGVCMRMSPFHWININCFISSYSNKLTNEKMCRNGGEEWLIEEWLIRCMTRGKREYNKIPIKAIKIRQKERWQALKSVEEEIFCLLIFKTFVFYSFAFIWVSQRAGHEKLKVLFLKTFKCHCVLDTLKKKKNFSNNIFEIITVKGAGCHKTNKNMKQLTVCLWF